MSRRNVLVGVSIAGHAALFTGVFVANAWRLDQLEYEARTHVTLGAIAAPAAEGGAIELPKQTLQKKVPKVVVKVPVQPFDRTKVRIEKPTSTGGGGGLGEGKGPPGSIGTDPEATCTEGPCLPAPPVVPVVPEVPKVPDPPAPRFVAPQVLKGLRREGETAIRPSREVAQQMQRDGVMKTSAVLKVCVSTSGAVASVGAEKSTKYAAYDEALVSAARRWVYTPYTVNGSPVPVCGMVTFLYEMK